MTKKGINAFLVTHEDEHLLENTPQNYERLSWISGFTGSAGYMIITLTNLFLFVDIVVLLPIVKLVVLV